MLYVMAELVRQRVGLSEVARCAETILEFVVELEVDVDALVDWTIERAHRRLSNATASARCIAKEDEFGIVPWGAHLGRQQLRPRGLRRIEHPGDELDLGRFFGCLFYWSDFTTRRLIRRVRRRRRKKVATE